MTGKERTLAAGFVLSTVFAVLLQLHHSGSRVFEQLLKTLLP